MTLFLLLASAASATEATPEPASVEPAPILDPVQPVVPTAVDPADFADALLRLDDPFNALTWYRLALFEDAQRVDAAALRFRAAYALERGQQWTAAELAYGDLASEHPELAAEATWRQGMVQAQAGRLDATAFTLDGIAVFQPESPWAARAPYALGVLALEAEDWAGARGRFESAELAGGELAGGATRALVLMERPLPNKSPVAAALLSGVVPGLGQVYAGHLGDGAMAFTANGVLGFWSYTLLRSGIEDDSGWRTGAGSVLAAMTAAAWTSNVIGSYRGARRFNRHEERRACEAVLEQVYEPALQLHPDEVELPPRITP